MPRFACASWLAVAALGATLFGFWGTITQVPPRALP